MLQCHQCSGFIPTQLGQCPNCESKPRSLKYLFKRLSQMIMGTGFMMTLAACYGTPPEMLLPDCKDVTDANKDKVLCLNSTPSSAPSSSASPSSAASLEPTASPTSVPSASTNP